jgi:hypothetical protein
MASFFVAWSTLISSACALRLRIEVVRPGSDLSLAGWPVEF